MPNACHAIPGRAATARQDALLYYRSATKAEIDFTAGWLDGVPYEGKCTEGAWLRETQTATAAYGRCVLATRNVTERVSDDKRQLLATPCGLHTAVVFANGRARANSSAWFRLPEVSGTSTPASSRICSASYTFPRDRSDFTTATGPLIVDR